MGGESDSERERERESERARERKERGGEWAHNGEGQGGREGGREGQGEGETCSRNSIYPSTGAVCLKILNQRRAHVSVHSLIIIRISKIIWVR